MQRYTINIITFVGVCKIFDHEDTDLDLIVAGTNEGDLMVESER